jgi:uncharacterized metal-binding protein
MPSGKTHDRITLWTLPLVVLLAFYTTLSNTLTIITCLGFLLGGFMLGPDLDIHSVQYRRWGPLRWIWLPYRGALNHRSKFSHGPLIGTVIRVVYLGAWLALFGLIAIATLNSFWNAQLSWYALRDTLRFILVRYCWEWVALVVGLELGALSHYVSDWLSTSFKGMMRSQRRKKR